MTEKWRPEGWKNPHTMDSTGFKKLSFEDGADAILDSLRKMGEHTNSIDRGHLDELPYLTNAIPPNDPIGTIVFIPDDKEVTP